MRRAMNCLTLTDPVAIAPGTDSAKHAGRCPSRGSVVPTSRCAAAAMLVCPATESVPGADRGPRAGSPRGVVVATGSRDRHHTSCDPVATAPGTDSVADWNRAAGFSNRCRRPRQHKRTHQPSGREWDCFPEKRSRSRGRRGRSSTCGQGTPQR